MSCERCEYFKNNSQWLTAMGNGLYHEDHFSHCPMCGSPLSDPTPLSLEELKQWDRAIWLACGHWQGWAFPHWTEFDNHFHFNCKLHDVISRAPEDYQSGSRWVFVCYTHKPKNGDNDD